MLVLRYKYILGYYANCEPFIALTRFLLSPKYWWPRRDRRVTEEVHAGRKNMAHAFPSPNATNDPLVVTRVGIRVTPFWKNKPDFWFMQLEAQFETSGIIVDDMKYYHILQTLDDESLFEVCDILRNLPATGRYAALKNRLIKNFEDSAEEITHPSRRSRPRWTTTFAASSPDERFSSKQHRRRSSQISLALASAVAGTSYSLRISSTIRWTSITCWPYTRGHHTHGEWHCIGFRTICRF